MDDNPLDLFREVFALARRDSPLRHPGAMCVSTVDLHGIPDGRFVDLKEVSEAGFTFCTDLGSAKATALSANPHVALTFWWDHIGRQVRVVGVAARISEGRADEFFRQRPRDARLAAWASRQSHPLDDPAALAERLRLAEERFNGSSVERPDGWGGYCVTPSRIEFLTFRADRLHERVVFRKEGSGWRRQRLQP